MLISQVIKSVPFAKKLDILKSSLLKGNSILSPTENMSIVFGLRKLIHVKSTRNPRKTGFLLLTINFHTGPSEGEQLMVSRQWVFQVHDR